MQYGNHDGGTRGLNQCSVGYENSAGTDGLQMVYNADYLHSNMAILIYPPINWFSSSLHSGFLSAGNSLSAIITFDGTDLAPGVYSGHLDLDSNDPDEGSVDIPVTFTIGSVGIPDISYSITSLSDTLLEGNLIIHNLIVRNFGTADLFLNLSATEFNLANTDGGTDLPADIMNTWLFIAPAADTLAPGDSIIAQITLDARFIGSGVYNGRVNVQSNDPDTPNGNIPVALNVQTTGPNCSYVPGDINNNGAFNGIDVTFGVGYFKGGNPPPYSCECTPGNIWFVAGDVNGNCTFNGIDITYAVGYFKGGPGPIPCSNCPPVLLESGNSKAGADAK
jgi:hypothetical protein